MARKAEKQKKKKKKYKYAFFITNQWIKQGLIHREGFLNKIVIQKLKMTS